MLNRFARSFEDIKINRTYAAYKENLYLKGVWGTAPIEGEALELPPTKFL